MAERGRRLSDSSEYQWGEHEEQLSITRDLRRSRSMSPPAVAHPHPPAPVSHGGEDSDARQEPAEGIQVHLRLRPTNDVEIEEGLGDCVHVSEDHPGEVRIDTRGSDRSYTFMFSNVFRPLSTQEEVYHTVARPLVADVLSGLNCSVLAYGQTGTGKTFTMQGPGYEDPRTLESGLNQTLRGITPRLLEDLFGELNFRRDSSDTFNYSVKVSYIEIYMELVIDLLSPIPGDVKRADRQIRIFKRPDGGIAISGVREVEVGSSEEMRALIIKGGKNRVTACHRMNKESSRSHAIVIASIVQADEKETVRSQLYLVDLAGSESVAKTNATGVRLREAQLINRSLLALSQVMFALERSGGSKSSGSRSSHIPYRDSKLTRLLENSLGGNSRTSIIITCSPNAYNDKESLSTMRFGRRAKTIENTVSANVQRSVAELEQLLQQSEQQCAAQRSYIADLEARLSELLGGDDWSDGIVPIDSRLGTDVRVPGNVPSDASTTTEEHAAEPQSSTSLIATPQSNHGESASTSASASLVSVSLPVSLQVGARQRSAIIRACTCPITSGTLEYPVVAADGMTYERVAIERWFAEARATSPVTGTTLPATTVYPNYALQRILREVVQCWSQDECPYFEVLPPELIAALAWHLPVRALNNLMRTCRYLYHTINTNDVWHALLERDFPDRAEPSSMGADGTPWKGIYKHLHSRHKKRKRSPLPASSMLVLTSPQTKGGAS